MLDFYDRLRTLRWAALSLVALVIAFPGTANAQERSVGGHVGVAMPLIAHGQNDTTMLTDKLIVSVPIGIVVRKNTAVPLDIAAVPTFYDRRVDIAVSLNTAHGVGHGFAAGLGVLADLSNRSWGFAPSIDKKLRDLPGGKVLLGDLFAPVQFHKDSQGARYFSAALVMHVGVAF